MWSHLYAYYYIQGGVDSNRCANIEIVGGIMQEFAELKQVAQVRYNNVDDFPWCTLDIVYQTDGSYTMTEDVLPSIYPINLISIVCSKGSLTDLMKCEALYYKIAQRLEWKLYLEEDDEGNEDVEIIIARC